LCGVKEAQKPLGDIQRMRRELLTLETRVSPTTKALHGQDKQPKTKPNKQRKKHFLICFYSMPDTHATKSRFSHDVTTKRLSPPPLLPVSAEHSININSLEHKTMPTLGRLK